MQKTNTNSKRQAKRKIRIRIITVCRWTGAIKWAVVRVLTVYPVAIPIFVSIVCSRFVVVADKTVEYHVVQDKKVSCFAGGK